MFPSTFVSRILPIFLQLNGSQSWMVVIQSMHIIKDKVSGIGTWKSNLWFKVSPPTDFILKILFLLEPPDY